VGGGKRGPKPQIVVEGELMARALLLREQGVGTEAIARALSVPRISLRDALERVDAEEAKE
jgi:hypothetical protein